MQPIKFQPLLKQTLWGGDKIVAFKHLDSQLENVGESWEISGVKDNETIVKEGPLKGKSLNEVVAGTTSALEMSFRCSSSLSMPVRIYPSRYTLTTKLLISRESPAAKRRCGI